MTTRTFRPLLASLLLGFGVAASSPALAQDGLFGFLHFGGSQPQSAPRVSPSAPRVSTYAPMELRVRPRSASRPTPSHSARAHWSHDRESHVATRDVQMAQKEAYARLNPANNPSWYLEDPTLRAGDIVVMKSGIMVYAGGKSAVHQERDFQPIAKADSISPAERENIGKVSVANAN